jgi:hypothetical protein
MFPCRLRQQWVITRACDNQPLFHSLAMLKSPALVDWYILGYRWARGSWATDIVGEPLWVTIGRVLMGDKLPMTKQQLEVVAKEAGSGSDPDTALYEWAKRNLRSSNLALRLSLGGSK